MHLLRDLSIGRKLGLSALAALLLLGGMYWSARTDLMTVARQQRRAEDALQAQRAVGEALLVGARMQAIGQRIPTVQILPHLAVRLREIGKETARGHKILQAVRDGGADETAQSYLTAAGTTLDRFAAVLRAAATMRRTIVLQRGRDLIQARPTFEFSMTSFAKELADGGTVANGVDGVTAGLPGAGTEALPGGAPAVLPGGGTPVPAAPAAATAKAAMIARALRRFDAYRLAMAHMQNAALLFLATGNLGAANAVDDGVAASVRAMKALLASGIPASTQSDAQTVGMLGTGIAHAAQAAVGRTITLDKFVAGPVRMMERNMAASLAAASRELARQAMSARLAAHAAQTAAQRRLLMIAGAIALVLVLSGGLTARAIGRPIRAMTRGVQAMAAGDARVAIGFAGRRDEIGRMATALEVLRGVVREAFVKADMFRQLPIGVMTAEPDGEFRITYLNPAVEQLLEFVKAHLPAPPGELLGQSIDIFHLAPAHQRALLADPANLPHRARVRVGDETFDLFVSAIRDRDGAYVGPMVTWHRATEQVRLVARFEGTVGAIARDVGARALAMRETARSMSTVAGDAGGRTTAVAAASEEAATNVSAVAASAEELSASVSEISRQVAESARIASQAVHEAEATDRSVTGLSEAAARIGEVVRLISDIAGRTNLLALNATIEAARAGEAGKGFAVVASEVKTLATQTARATEEIGSQIAAMQGATGHAVEALRSIAGTIQQMNGIATTIAGAVEEQGAATQEIARAVQQAAAGTNEVTTHIAHVAEAVRQTGGEAGTVQDAANELATQSDRLTAEAETFLAAIQQAA
jgi:methyl-accepting chemotaxis protein